MPIAALPAPALAGRPCHPTQAGTRSVVTGGKRGTLVQMVG
jgi:hypothetical protein